MPLLAVLVSGLLFGLGLAVSGMANPAKVVNFLDVAGSWDPTLLFVMGGALAVTFVGYRVALARPKPLWAPSFSLPTARDIDVPLVAGAALFGLGWGLAGICPGPALAGLVLVRIEPVVFIAAMAAGMILIKAARVKGSDDRARPAMSGE